MATEQKSTSAMPRLVSIILGIAGALVALILLREFKSFVAPVLLALNLVITAYPLHTWLTKKGAPQWISSIALMLTVFAVLIGMIGGLAWSIAKMVEALPNYSDEFNQLYEKISSFAVSLGLDNQAISMAMESFNPQSLVSAFTSLLSGTSEFIGMLLIVVLAIFFMSMDCVGFDGRMERLARSRPRAAAGLKQFAQGVRRYWVVTTVFGLIVAVLDGIALAIMKVPLPIVWALLSFLTNYIPNIGFVIGMLPPALIALFANGWQTAVWVVIIYSLLNFVVQSLIQPRFTGESVGVTPTVSFLSLLLWSAVLGGLGSLLALPMTLLVKALLIDIDPKASWSAVLFSSDPKTVDMGTPADD